MIATPGLRAVGLAGVALIAIVVALALHGGKHHSTLPGAAGNWYTALAAPYTPASSRAKSACGVAIGAKTIGVAHPVLPCGVKVYVSYQGHEVLTQVIDRGQRVPGREFDLTRALAKLLHLEGTQTIQWRFAR